jgi:hypothetical protein
VHSAQELFIPSIFLDSSLLCYLPDTKQPGRKFGLSNFEPSVLQHVIREGRQAVSHWMLSSALVPTGLAFLRGFVGAKKIGGRTGYEQLVAPDQPERR